MTLGTTQSARTACVELVCEVTPAALAASTAQVYVPAVRATNEAPVPTCVPFRAHR